VGGGLLNAVQSVPSRPQWLLFADDNRGGVLGNAALQSRLNVTWTRTEGPHMPLCVAGAALAERLLAIARTLDASPTLDTRSADEILGYNESGLFD
jgi:hypothetical protein